MLKAIIEVAMGIFIIVGTVGVLTIAYVGFNSAIYDPSVPHGWLWQAFFSPDR